MRLAFHNQPTDIGLGKCSIHNVVHIYVIFMGLNNDTKKVRVGFICEKCWEIHGEETAVTTQDFTINEFKKEFYFEDRVADN